jgi:uncharacterized membrane protein YfcA
MDSSYWIAFPAGILIATVSSIAGIGGGIVAIRMPDGKAIQ